MNGLVRGEFEIAADEAFGIDSHWAGNFTLEGEAAIGIGVAERVAGGFLNGCARNRRACAIGDCEIHESLCREMSWHK